MRGFASLNPRVLALYFLSVLLITMFMWNPAIQIISLLGSLLLLSTLTSAKEMLSDICFYAVLILLIIAVNLMFSHNGETPMFFLNGNPITFEALLYGAEAGVMIVSVIAWCKCLSRIITTDKFQYIFGGVAPEVMLILSMALRFIPLFKRQYKRVSNAQKAMGIYSQESRADKLKGGVWTLSALTSWSLENAVETGNAMKARGYGLKPRSHYAIFKFGINDFLIALIVIAFTVVVLISSSLGKLDFYFYPNISGFDLSYLSITAYISFGVLTLMPYFIETKEDIKWKFYISRI